MAKAFKYVSYHSAAHAHGDSLRRQMELSADFSKNQGLVLDRSLAHNGLRGFTGGKLKKDVLATFIEGVHTRVKEVLKAALLPAQA